MFVVGHCMCIGVAGELSMSSELSCHPNNFGRQNYYTRMSRDCKSDVLYRLVDIVCSYCCIMTLFTLRALGVEDQVTMSGAGVGDQVTLSVLAWRIGHSKWCWGRGSRHSKWCWGGGSGHSKWCRGRGSGHSKWCWRGG